MARIWFPENLTDPQHLHWMNINCFEQDSYKDTITLFVPGGGQNGSMSWEHAHDYTDPKLARIAAGLLGIGAGGAGVLPGMMGAAINPKVEVLYRNTDLRKFQFNFLFAPTSQKESDSMEAIVQKLRYHSAPKIKGGYSDPNIGYKNIQGQFDYLRTGWVLDAPSEFTIDFYFNGRENMHLPKIGRSIIERIDVNYTPLGEFSSFSNGHPVSAMLTIVFRELRIIDKQNIERGY